MTTVRERGDDALVEWSKLLGRNNLRDARAGGRRRRRATGRCCCGARGAYLARRPASRRHRDRGLTRGDARTPLDAVAHGGHVRAAEPRLNAHHVRGPRPGGGGGADRGLHTAQGSAAVAATAALLGIDEVWALGGPRRSPPGLRHRVIAQVDKIVGPGNGGGQRGEAQRAVATSRSTCPRDPGRSWWSPMTTSTRRSSLRRSPPRWSTARSRRIRRASGRRPKTPSPRSRDTPPSTSSCWASGRVAGPRIRNAGAVFVGPSSPVPAGDYATGGNHVLPTGGWARSTGGLGLETFMKTVTVQRVTNEGLERLRPPSRRSPSSKG